MRGFVFGLIIFLVIFPLYTSTKVPDVKVDYSPAFVRISSPPICYKINCQMVTMNPRLNKKETIEVTHLN